MYVFADNVSSTECENKIMPAFLHVSNSKFLHNIKHSIIFLWFKKTPKNLVISMYDKGLVPQNLYCQVSLIWYYNIIHDY